MWHSLDITTALAHSVIYDSMYHLCLVCVIQNHTAIVESKTKDESDHISRSGHYRLDRRGGRVCWAQRSGLWSSIIEYFNTYNYHMHLFIFMMFFPWCIHLHLYMFSFLTAILHGLSRVFFKTDFLMYVL